jgi:hypothetical protein
VFFLYLFIYLATLILGKNVKKKKEEICQKFFFFWKCDQILAKLYKISAMEYSSFFLGFWFLEVEKFAPSSPEKKKKKRLLSP